MRFELPALLERVFVPSFDFAGKVAGLLADRLGFLSLKFAFGVVAAALIVEKVDERLVLPLFLAAFLVGRLQLLAGRVEVSFERLRLPGQREPAELSAEPRGDCCADEQSHDERDERIRG